MITNFAFIDITSPEALLILLLAAFIFGGKRVADTSKSIGNSLRGIKEETSLLSTKVVETRQSIKNEVVELKDSVSTTVGVTEKASPKKEDASR